ncbi:hypothetical protein [Winogradskyella vidalii]|uniref:hypothetical protein n=1 Tax=Winogradskyella vidalii TaxID=2615024 RepID=UPI0015CDF042|nr:hypothetical protein [Winogradskyella vidalii]
MNKSYIEFRKERDFSSILSDTFGFIRNEFKPFIKTIFNIAGPAIIIFMTTLAAYNYVSGDMFNFSTFGQPDYSSSNIILVAVTAICYLIAAIVAYIFSVSAALFYIKDYVEHKGVVDPIAVKNNVHQSFWSFFGLSFLKGITIIIATMLCVLPVLYAMVPMAIVFSIYVFQPKMSTSDAFSQSFKLVNIDFWTAFGAFIVFGIIYYILGMVFSVPTVIYTLISTGIFSGEVDPVQIGAFSQDPILIFLNVLNTFFQFLLNLILVVAGAMIYFHLHEKTHYTGTYDRINEIGNTEN